MKNKINYWIKKLKLMSESKDAKISPKECREISIILYSLNKKVYKFANKIEEKDMELFQDYGF